MTTKYKKNVDYVINKYDIEISDDKVYQDVTTGSKECPCCGGGVEFIEPDSNDPTEDISQSGYTCTECCRWMRYKG